MSFSKEEYRAIFMMEVSFKKLEITWPITPQKETKSRLVQKLSKTVKILLKSWIKLHKNYQYMKINISQYFHPINKCQQSPLQTVITKNIKFSNSTGKHQKFDKHLKVMKQKVTMGTQKSSLIKTFTEFMWPLHRKQEEEKSPKIPSILITKTEENNSYKNMEEPINLFLKIW